VNFESGEAFSQWMITEHLISTVPWDDCGSFVRFSVTFVSDKGEAGEAEVIAEVDRKELGRLTKREWFSRFAYVVEDDAYFDMIDRREMTRSAFNAVFRHVDCKSIHTQRKVEASVCYDENRQGAGARVLRGLTYAAGESVLVAKDSEVYGNRWINARPDLSGVASGDVTPWLAHAELLIPDQVEREYVLDVMAFKLQNPQVKINHAVLHGGDEGCGKDTFWFPFIWSVCGPDLRNRGLVDADGINSRWGYALESEILILTELKGIARVVDEGRHIGRHEVLALSQADDQR
jgi:hypothetical protein